VLNLENNERQYSQYETLIARFVSTEEVFSDIRWGSTNG
jgi:hypothetical protein